MYDNLTRITLNIVYKTELMRGGGGGGHCIDVGGGGGAQELEFIFLCASIVHVTSFSEIDNTSS